MTDQHTIHKASPGPWGELEYFFTYLNPPPGVFSKRVLREKTEWAFIDQDYDQAKAVFRDCGLDLNGEAEFVKVRNGMLVRPRNEFVAQLPEETRATLYPRLYEADKGVGHFNEFVIEGGNYREISAGLGIPDEIVELVETRSMTSGRKRIFMDTPLALSMIPDQATKVLFLQSLARTRTLVGRLRVDSGMDLSSIAQWWSAGPNRSRALPLLETALRARTISTIDLLHLLPPVPRRLLNTYATERDTLNGVAPDCYWAAMNFFSEVASDRFLDEQLPRHYYFNDEWFKFVAEPNQFGDVSVLHHPKNGGFVHAWVHIADDIVYTKNGSGRFFPYVLMRKEDMLSRYLESEDLEIHGFRNRALGLS